MTTNDNLSLPNDASQDHVMTVHPAGATTYAGNADWAGLQEAPKGLSPFSYLHAVRRHWLIATTTGLICAVALGVAAWFIRGPEYTANAYLRVLPTNPQVVFTTHDSQSEAGVPNAFDIFKETQQQLLRTRFVLTAALRDPKVKGLASIQREDQRHNSLEWLGDQLHVVFPGKNSEIMQVSLSLPDANETAKLVNAVVQAYFDEVINAERVQRRARLSELQSVYAEKENDVRSKRTELKQLAETLGTTDDETLSLKQQIAVQQYAEFRRELNRMQFDLTRARGKLQEQQAQLERIDSLEIPEGEVLAMAQADPRFKVLAEQQIFAQLLNQRNQTNIVPGTSSGFVRKNEQEMHVYNGQYEEMQRNVRERIRAMKRNEFQKEARRLETEVAILTEQTQQFEKDVERQRKDAEQVGRGSIDVKMMLSEVKHLDQILASVAEERERLKVELRSAPRVVILGNQDQPAEVPLTESHAGIRLLITLFSSLLGLCLPVIGIALWDIRTGRINDAAEVSQVLGMRVLGSVPMIPARIIRQLGSPSKQNQTWRTRLTESVDGVAARLIRKAEQEQARVILISSAMPGEGKTTLATQLAMSLARSMRRTVLVDFDLRRPALDGIFGLPAEPGVCDALRDHDDVMSLVHPTATDELSIVTAGRWDRQMLAASGNGTAATLVNQLRANFEFVIIDSSPILPVADTRLLSPLADMVILSVFRDVSQGRRVLAAYEILDAFGVRSVETVVTGEHELCYGKGMEYEPLQVVPQDVPEDAAEQVDPE